PLKSIDNHPSASYPDKQNSVGYLRFHPLANKGSSLSALSAQKIISPRDRSVIGWENVNIRNIKKLI
ncbi:MAG: hypothetical protein KDI43_15055, partial [Gammaproteobacteria bacterium]|nr:hypothetical protein [Gammaproteobacteria bacterium]